MRVCVCFSPNDTLLDFERIVGTELMEDLTCGRCWDEVEDREIECGRRLN